MKTEELLTEIEQAFLEGRGCPPMTLRSGNSIDSYSDALPYDPTLDRITDEYLEENHWGVAHLDAESWRFYLPHLLRYAIRNQTNGQSGAIGSLIESLRPPDREPPRVASLSHQQTRVVEHVLNQLGFDEKSKFKDQALQALEEYWMPGALYRSQ